MTEPVLETFRAFVMRTLREVGPGVRISKAMLRAKAKAELPALCDDTAPCGCSCHQVKWHHILDRALYDLRNTNPPKVRSVPLRSGWYELV